MIWIVMILAQIGLGAWTIWSNKAADVATAHMALGALSLLVGALLAFRLFCGAQTQDFVLPDAPNASLMERIA
jgi:heme a synthase